jgi:hypothetical protein
MKRLIPVVLLCVSSALAAQTNRGAELDKALEEARAAYLALKEAEERRDQGVEPQAGERLGTAAGSTRPSEQYVVRQTELERAVELARLRYEGAMKRWNDLK